MSLAKIIIVFLFDQPDLAAHLCPFDNNVSGRSIIAM